MRGDNAGRFKVYRIFCLVKCFQYPWGGSKYGIDSNLLFAVLFQFVFYVDRPGLELLERKVRASDKAKLGCGIGILPDNRIVVLNSFKLGVVNTASLSMILTLTYLSEYWWAILSGR